MQIDTSPRGMWQGLRTADLHIKADARATAEAVAGRLRERGIRRPGWRSNAVGDADRRPTSRTAKEFALTPGTLTHGRSCANSTRRCQRTGTSSSPAGIASAFAMTHLQGRQAGKYHTPLDFGAIGSGLSAAIGVAVARGNDKVMLIEGDGSLYQHIQELETVRRHGLKLLICILNDGGYGAETHKFRATGGDPMHATHGRGDIAAIARGFGLNAATVTEMGQLDRLFRDHQRTSGATLWDVHINDLIPSRNFRRVHYGEA